MKLLLLVWCLSVSIVGSAQQEPKLKFGPELISYPEIAKRMSIGNRRVECARSLQNTMAVIHLKARPWSEVRQLLEKGLDVQFRLKSVQEENKESSKSPNTSEKPQAKQFETRIEVWVMERAPETVRIENEQRRRLVDYWLEKVVRFEGFAFVRAFSDLPYRDVRDFFKQYEQQRENMVKQMMERPEEFTNASTFTEVMKKYGPDLSSVPPPILQRLKKTADELKKMLQEMKEEEEFTPAPEIQEFLQVNDESIMQMILLFADSMPNSASLWLLNRWWEQGLIPEMAREAILKGVSVRAAPLSQALLKDIPLEDLLNDSLFKASDAFGVEPPKPHKDIPSFDYLVFSLNLAAMGETLNLQAKLNACLPNIYSTLPSFFSVDVSLNGPTYARVMQTDKKSWAEKNRQLGEFLKRDAMQKKFSCERKSSDYLSRVLLAWAQQTGYEVISEYSPLHDFLQPSWASYLAQSLTMDESTHEAIAQMESEAIESDLSVTNEEEDADPAPSTTVPHSQPIEPPAKQEITLARTFGDKTLYDLHESRGVLIVRSRWPFLSRTWDTPTETVLKMRMAQLDQAGDGRSALDYDTLYTYFRAVHPHQDVLIGTLYFPFYRADNSISHLRPAVYILSVLSPAERRRLLTEGGAVPLSSLPGVALAQLVNILRANPEQFPNAWHPKFADLLPAWQLRLNLNEGSGRGELAVSLDSSPIEGSVTRSDEEDEVTLFSSRGFYLGKIKALGAPQYQSGGKDR